MSAGRLSTFLLLDDDWLVCELLSRMLQSSGRRILTATNETVAVEHAKATRLDLFVTDLGRPTALDVVARLRTVQPHLRVLYMCAWANNGMSADVRDVGVVLKPFTLDELERAVARSLDRPSSSPAPTGGGAR